MLANCTEEDPADTEAEELSDDEDDDPTCPTIRYSAKEKEQIQEPWRQSLIVTVMGRRVGYAYLLRRLTSMWRPKGRMDLIALDNDYFLVKFGFIEDLEFAKYEGPWMVLDHYLIVKDWVPNFDPIADTTEKVLVWVRFPSIPVEYYNYLSLRRIGNKLGRTVRVDHTTSLVSRGKFARVCVELDITKPLVSTFTMEEKVWKVAYEGIHLVCFSCGLYGHRQESCPTSPIEATVVVSTDQNADPGQAVANADPTAQVAGVQQGHQTSTRAKPYGPWMIAPRRDRRPTGRPAGPGKTVAIEGLPGNVSAAGPRANTSGSRFAPLEDDPTSENHSALEDSREPVHQRETQPAQQTAATTTRNQRTRRANVVVNERQIINEPAEGRLVSVLEKEESSRANQSASRPRRAAEEDEHVVICGEQGGQVINETRVVTGDAIAVAPNVNSNPMSEHHADPPNAWDEEGDAVMEIENPNELDQAEGGVDA
ncbi:uncharacterized protein LOC116027061 [Ipomoea triloba]|uniref:uncharacterized protein LOC116027061 n=1 Tax=Ipomoea triloba TaxID=35885 RepID=UPI00125D530F|nr:uncharacterized protein LOC116027061 [Ipomoea triloba]